MSTISVNLKIARTAPLAVALACAPFRAAPPVDPGEWRASLGGAERSAYASVELGDSVRVDWQKGFGRGIATGLQVHSPLLVATTTNRTVVTINEETGGQYWGRSFSGPIAGAALRRNELLYVATGQRDNRLHAITMERGRRIWSSRRFGNFRLEPVLLEDRLVAVTETGLVVAVNESDGTELWRRPLGAPPASPPTTHGDHIVVTSSRDTLYRIRVSDGTVTGKLALPGTASAAPLIEGNSMVLPVFPEHVVAVDLAALTVSPAITLSAPSLAAPVPAGAGGAFLLTRAGDVFRFVDGIAQRVARLGGAASGSLTAVGSRLVVGRLDGALFLLDRDGEIIWREDLRDSITAPVAAVDRTLFVPLLHGDVVRLETR